MDKLRAIDYFNRAAELGTFAAAARSFDVSNPAVTQLIAALERSLGTTLFDRTAHGLALTADGKRYYEVVRDLATGLHQVEQQLGPRGAKPRGTLTVGLRSGVGQNCVMPHIGRFLFRYPDIELVLKQVETSADIEGENVDLAVMTGWPPDTDYVVRPLAQTRNLICASADYWHRRGSPVQPVDLLDHDCLVFRSGSGTLLDRWSFEKDGERQVVDVKCRLLSDDATWIQEAARAGAGVIRVGDLSLTRSLVAGSLVPVLTDWEAKDAPSHFALYRPGQRRSKLVRVFVDFLVEIFGELDASRQPAPGGAIAGMPRPDWFGRAHGRQSDFAARTRVG